MIESQRGEDFCLLEFVVEIFLGRFTGLGTTKVSVILLKNYNLINFGIKNIH